MGRREERGAPPSRRWSVTDHLSATPEGVLGWVRSKITPGTQERLAESQACVHSHDGESAPGEERMMGIEPKPYA